MRDHVKINETKKIAKFAGQGSSAAEIARHLNINEARVQQFMPDAPKASQKPAKAKAAEAGAEEASDGF